MISNSSNVKEIDKSIESIDAFCTQIRIRISCNTGKSFINTSTTSSILVKSLQGSNIHQIRGYEIEDMGRQLQNQDPD
jgi:hypothetical protein